MQRQVCWFIVAILTVLAGGLLWNLEPPSVTAISTPRLFAGAHTSNLDLIPLQNIKRIATGASHACAVTTSGGLKCWGANDFGQLGDNTEIIHNLPTDVFGLGSGVTAVVAGLRHTCALIDAGGVKCWGANESGQLGDSTQTSRKIPVEVQGFSSGVLAVAAGGAHTCALTSSGGVKCWGANNFGQLGDGTTITRTAPVDVNGLASGATAIVAGDDYTCAIVNGAVLCWGHNRSGQLGDGTNTDRVAPTNVSGLSSGASALDAGSVHTCAIINGGARCWGENSNGQLGNDSEISTNTPVNVFNLSSGVTAITAGEKYTCALTNSGVKCWGENQFGQLGAGVSNYITQPTDVVGLPSGVAEVAAGGRYTCARMNSGGVKCWGLGVSGQLGDGVSYLSTTPVVVTGLSNGVSALALGGGHSCALVNGGAKCWGDNSYRQLGNPVFGASPAPVDVAITGSTLIGLATDSDHTCALTNNGALKCWGANYWGQLGGGDNQFTDQIVDVTGLATGVITFTVGYNHACAVVGVKAKCWGYNNYGQLGNGNTTDRSTPVDVTGLQSDTVVALAGGGYHTCALTQSGGVKCWGFNREGELGQGSTTDHETTPLLVSGLSSDVVGLSAGLYHTCALLKTGGVKCWGTNDFGQLGDKTTQDRRAPIDVFGLSSGVKALVTGYYYSCALLNSGEIKCWGDNSNGQLGDGAFGLANSRNAPVTVTGLTDAATLVAAGSGHTCARLSGGGVKCWGNGADGQLGNGQVAWRATPADVLVPGTPTTPTVTSTLTPTSNPVITGTPTPPATVIPGTGDDYEDDDACERAHLISSDGVVQLHSFHDQADADWVKVNVVAGATYQIEVIVPATSAADVQLQLLDKCDGAATAHDAFGPGLRLRVKAQADGAYYLRLINYDPEVAGAADTYQLFVRKLEEGPQPGALVVVGGRLRVNDELQTNIYAATNRVYQLFLRHGYPAERIYYLANDLEQNPDKDAQTQDVDDLATRERLNYAITQWATDPKLGLGPERAFTLYLMDHGDYDKLFLNGRNETVGPDDLDQWLTVLETARPGVKVNVIIDACLSGSFIDPAKSLSKPGRVVITSASNNSNAYADREGGAVFTSAFMQALDGDTSLFGAYAEARQVGLAWPFAQNVWLDDNGNGVANETGDGQLAQQRGFAFAGSFDPGDAESPYIAWVKGPQAITNRRGEIRALVRTNSPNLDVWAVIYDPTYSPPPPSETLPVDSSRATIRLEDLDKDGVYTGLFAGFDQPGNYTIVIYAVDDAHLQSRPKQVLFLVGSQNFLPMVSR